ncbi:MAG: hypothetical protein O7G85_02105 [Planctomycetota bacterium]|nr:hypothetical protein [Planctomycetota bacterium]
MTSPDDPIKLWGLLLQPQTAPLLDALQRDPEITSSNLMRLRKDWDASLINVAIELLRARVKARAKFTNTDRLVADVVGMEQASSELVALHKAQRFASIQPDRIVDLCCGIGGDAMSLQPVAPVLAIDADPLRAWMAGENAQCDTESRDVQTFSLNDAVFHLDPSRRDESSTNPRRHWRFEEYQPGPEYIAQLLRDNHDGAIKLGPGVDLEALEKLTSIPMEIEIINERGTLTQAVLWSGKLAFNPGRRTATMLSEDSQVVQFTGTPQNPEFGELKNWIHAIDPALERAGLMGTLAQELGMASLHPQLGLLTSERNLESPWLTSFRVEKEMPWRLKNVKAWLQSEQAGIVEVKTRGGAVNPDKVQAQLRGGGTQAFTVFVLRFGAKVRALCCRRANSLSQV